MPPRLLIRPRRAAAAVATGVLLVLTGCDSGEPATPSGAGTPVTPATPAPTATPPDTAAPGAADEAAEDAQAAESAEGAEAAALGQPEAAPQLPSDYERRNVPFTEHISLPVPTGWERTSTDPYTYDYRDPTGQVLLRARLDPEARQPRAYAQLERDLHEIAETWQGFQYVKLEWYACCQMDLRPDISAAEAEFTFTLEGVTRHALQRAVVDPDLGRVTIHFSAPKPTWSRCDRSQSAPSTCYWPDSHADQPDRAQVSPSVVHERAKERPLACSSASRIRIALGPTPWIFRSSLDVTLVSWSYRV